MASKRGKIEALLVEVGVTGEGDWVFYEGYFACFNRQMYYEAHEVLEELWQPIRRQPNGNFYKGLIQLAGAFVHLQKAKRGPALRLLRMAHENLSVYPAVHQRLEVGQVLGLIQDWISQLQQTEPLLPELVPKLRLRLR